ncbi:MAG TPA: cofactor-independent phosphoglycerate mutase [Clostridiales bacterium]|nr:cofactor-independent phosphoglycerate mutase [Clostridiales bacterium]
MKYIIVLGDGMADEPIDMLGGKTPLEYAATPTLDRLAPQSEIALVHTIPDGMAPGSDTANLAVLGYNPRTYYSGRSPLEALSIGVDMKPTDIALRTNIVTLSDEPDIPFEQRTIVDHSSGEISTADAAVLLEAVKKEFEKDTYHFYVGTSYRHLLIWEHGEVIDLAPPHDHLGEVIAPYLPEDAVLRDMMVRSYTILNDHPINVERARRGLNKANCLWFWGAGTRPALSSFREKTGKTGVMISAVDLLKGIAVGAGMDVIEVEGATGSLDTNYEGKAMAAVQALLDGADFAYIHVEAPDEMGHQGNVAHKVRSIAYLDERVIRVVVDALTNAGEDFRLLVMPDHPTPIRCRTHTNDSIPYLLYDSTKSMSNGVSAYNETQARMSGTQIERGYTLIDKLFADEF